MSNSRKLRGTAGNGPRCASCGHRIPAGRERVALGGGRFGCAFCRDRGAFSQRLGCGHLGVPGRIVSDADNPGMSRCAACSGELQTVHEKITGRYA